MVQDDQERCLREQAEMDEQRDTFILCLVKDYGEYLSDLTLEEIEGIVKSGKFEQKGA